MEDRDDLARRVCDSVQRGAGAWGVHIISVLIEDVQITADMQKHLSVQTTAERAAVAKLIETEAAAKAKVIAADADAVVKAKLVLADAEAGARAKAITAEVDAVVKAKLMLAEAEASAQVKAIAAEADAAARTKLTMAEAEAAAKAKSILARGAAEAKLIESEADVRAVEFVRAATQHLDLQAVLQLRELDALKNMAAQAGTKTVFVPVHTQKNDAMPAILH